MKLPTTTVMLLLLTACPKKEIKSIDETERESALEELKNLTEDDLDDLPEAGEEPEDQRESSSH